MLRAGEGSEIHMPELHVPATTAEGKLSGCPSPQGRHRGGGPGRTIALLGALAVLPSQSGERPTAHNQQHHWCTASQHNHT